MPVLRAEEERLWLEEMRATRMGVADVCYVTEVAFPDESGGATAVPTRAVIPDVVYRGSGKAFDPATTRARDGAHWFTDDETHAATFGLVSAFNVTMSNPMEISQEDLDSAWDDAHPDGDQDERSLLPRDFVSSFIASASRAGHDGLIIRGMGDRDVQVDMFLPFKPEGINPVAPPRPSAS